MKKKSKKEREPYTRAWYVKQIEKLHPVYIRERDGNRCVICGSRENPTCGHIFTRRALSTRWDVTADGNCHCQCWKCNFSHGGTGMRGQMDKWPYFSWYIQSFGLDELENLHLRHNKPKKWTLTELEDLYEFLNQCVAK